MLMFERILITGATGSIGSCLVEQLIQDKELQLLTRSHEKAREFRARGIRTFVGDFDEPTTLYPALAGVEKLFLLSGADPRQVAQQGNMIFKNDLSLEFGLLTPVSGASSGLQAGVSQDYSGVACCSIQRLMRWSGAPPQDECRRNHLCLRRGGCQGGCDL